jgi:hypothetical protein
VDRHAGHAKSLPRFVLLPEIGHRAGEVLEETEPRGAASVAVGPARFGNGAGATALDGLTLEISPHHP